MGENKNYKIESLTPIYDKIEDRIRLAINYKDIHNRIDMMVTRSFVIDLLCSFDEYIHTYYPNQNTQVQNPLTIEASYNKKTNAIPKPIQSADTQTTKYASDVTQTNSEDIELYKSVEDLLVSVQLQFDKKTNLTTMILISKNNFKASSIMDIVLFRKIIETIKQAVPNVNWGISLHF